MVVCGSVLVNLQGIQTKNSRLTAECALHSHALGVSLGQNILCQSPPDVTSLNYVWTPSIVPLWWINLHIMHYARWIHSWKPVRLPRVLVARAHVVQCTAQDSHVPHKRYIIQRAFASEGWEPSLQYAKGNLHYSPSTDAGIVVCMLQCSFRWMAIEALHHGGAECKGCICSKEWPHKHA